MMLAAAVHAVYLSLATSDEHRTAHIAAAEKQLCTLGAAAAAAAQNPKKAHQLAVRAAS